MAATKTSPRKSTARKSATKRQPAKRAPRKRAKADAPLTPLEALTAWRNWTMLDDFWREIIPLPEGAALELERLALAADLTLEQLLAVPRLNPGRVQAGVERELNKLRQQDAEIASSGLAASALALAIELDLPGNSATAKANCARAMREALDRLRELVPPAEEEDSIAQLAARHTARTEGR